MKHYVFMLVAGCCLVMSGCVIGQIGYMKPASADFASAEGQMAEHCFSVFPGMLEGAKKTFGEKTGKEAWENVTLLYQQRFMDGCLRMHGSAGGK